MAVKLTEKSLEVLNYVRENGGKVAVAEIVEATGRNVRSITANATDLKKKGLIEKVDEEVEGQDKPIKYLQITPEGQAWTAPVEEE